MRGKLITRSLGIIFVTQITTDTQPYYSRTIVETEILPEEDLYLFNKKLSYCQVSCLARVTIVAITITALQKEVIELRIITVTF